MLAILAAAFVVAAPAEGTVTARLSGDLPGLAVPQTFREHMPALQSGRLCKGAGRVMTSYEPALLFREQDRAEARARRLIDLPPAQACLVHELTRADALPNRR